MQRKEIRAHFSIASNTCALRGEKQIIMAIYHCSAKGISRGVGRSATAAAAYRSGERIIDERTGEVYDYSKRTGVEHTEVILPNGGFVTRSALWNAAEYAEKRKDAKVAREWEIALPDELNQQQRIELTRSFATELVNRYGVAVDICIHAPGRHGDQRNHHAHILTTTRVCEGIDHYERTTQPRPEHLQGHTRDDLHNMSLSHLAKNGERQSAGVLLTPARFHGLSTEGLRRHSQQEIKLTQKTRVLDSPKTSGSEVTSMRLVWEQMVNRSLQQAGHDERIDHRSLAAQGIEAEPTKHLGPAATAMERRGLRTDRGDLNRSALGVRKAQEEVKQDKELGQGVTQVKTAAKAWAARKAAEKLAKEMEMYEQRKALEELERRKEETRRHGIEKNKVQQNNQVSRDSEDFER